MAWMDLKLVWSLLSLAMKRMSHLGHYLMAATTLFYLSFAVVAALLCCHLWTKVWLRNFNPELWNLQLLGTRYRLEVRGVAKVEFPLVSFWIRALTLTAYCMLLQPRAFSLPFFPKFWLGFKSCPLSSVKSFLRHHRRYFCLIFPVEATKVRKPKFAPKLWIIFHPPSLKFSFTWNQQNSLGVAFC